MAELFGVNVPAISKHLTNIFETSELEENSVISILETTANIEKYTVKRLERIVTMYLDFAELQAERQIPMKMEDWAKRLDALLQFNEYQILKDAGKVSHEIAI